MLGKVWVLLPFADDPAHGLNFKTKACKPQASQGPTLPDLTESNIGALRTRVFFLFFLFGGGGGGGGSIA